MSGFRVWKCGFCERRMFRKKQKTISCQVCVTSFHKRSTQISGKNFNLVSRNSANCYCQSCFVKNVTSSGVNESPTNDQNQSRNFLINIIITPNSNKIDFYNSCNSIEVPFNDDNHHILINSKYFNVNEINTLKRKENHFGILHLNIASLNKHIDGLFNLISLMKLNFPIIGMSEHKIGLNTPINNISLPGYAFCFERQKAPMVEQVFLLTKSIRILSELTLIFFKIIILNQLLLKLICLIKGILSVAASIIIPTCQ